MKSMIYFALTFIILSWGCGKSKDVQFCEGVSRKGEGVKCGTVFDEGTISVLVRSREQWGVKQIKLQIYELRKNKYEKLETVYADVNPDKDYAHINISLYNEGKYKVKIFKSGTAIAEGDISIVE